MNNAVSITERQCLYFLQSTEVIGSVTINKLYDRFGSFESIYNAAPQQLSSLLSEKMLNRFIYDRAHKDIGYEFERLNKAGISYYLQCDDEYPSRLLELADAPLAILVNGHLPSPNIPSIAIIGARNCSNYGQAYAEQYASELALNGIQIISGMAMGIDGIAGRTALKTNGRSFAVLGSGPDVCYPTTNKDLFDALSINGGIISEYTLGVAGVGWHFPRRNRLIAALSDALIVIEAKEKSGTMITVDSALELGRDIYALPGRTSDVMSQGCNLLIKQGAQILISPEDFIAEFLTNISHKDEYADYFANLSDSRSLKDNGPLFSTPEEKIVFDCLDYTPQGLDQIYAKVNLQIPITISNLMVLLTNLTIAGFVVCIGGNYAWK